jgi:transposase
MQTLHAVPVVDQSSAGVLLMALELGQRTWKVGFTVRGRRVWRRTVAAGALAQLVREIGEAKRRFQLPADTPTVSCYEAGRDGFWIHRWLVGQGVSNYVVDSASIEVNRRARRRKSDPLDLEGLLRLLARYVAGERGAWRVVRVPTVAEEDARQLHRTRATLQQDRTRLINRLKSVLATQGVVLPIRRDFATRLATVRLWDGTSLPEGVRQRLQRDWTQLQGVTQQLKAVTACRRALPTAEATATGRYVTRLQQLKGVGPTGAWVLATEVFGWRAIRNGRQLGALAGLIPARYDSGEAHRDLGITRAGNRRVRWVMGQLAWQWLRYQPTSALSQWYAQRFAQGGRRHRRIGIVALARKLLIAWWHFVEHGVEIPGAELKSMASPA